jgi:predicted metal-dependent hydrolase
MTPRSRRRAPSFYERALDTADRAAFDEARDLDGLDDEVALLRLQVRRLLIQALVARHRLSGDQADSLGEAAANLLEEFGAIFAAGSEAGRG